MVRSVVFRDNKLLLILVTAAATCFILGGLLGAEQYDAAGGYEPDLLAEERTGFHRMELHRPLLLLPIARKRRGFYDMIIQGA